MAKKQKSKNQKKSKKNDQKITSNLARGDDGNIQITYTIPFSQIEEKRKKVAKKMAESVEVPGFRKGKAPLSKVINHLPQEKLLQSTLSEILPALVAESIKEHKLKPAVYPKFELVKAVEGEDWQVRAITCEIPEIKLGDYKKKIKGALRAKNIWTPGKGEKDEKEKKQKSQAEKEQEVMKVLVNEVDIKIPKLLIEEEVNKRLSNLLEKIEKLGLNLDSYLASVGKTPQTLREEYEKQAKEALKLDLALQKIAEEEKIKIDEKKIDEAIKVSANADPNLEKALNTPDQKRYIESVMKKREALSSLTNLA